MTRGCYDVAILGGGPAGCATALALKRRASGLRVLLVEKTDYSALRIGETLPPPAQRLLTELGVWPAFLRRSPMESYGTRAAWGTTAFQENEFIFSPYGRGWHLDRRDFDALLADEAEQAGVEVVRSAVAHVRGGRDDEWVLTLQEGDRATREVCARFVVDATGRRSGFSVTQGARHIVFDHLVGAAVFFRLDPREPGPDTYASVEACEDGWWLPPMLPDGQMAAIFMTDADRLRRLPWQTLEQWSALTASAPHTAHRLAGGTPIGEPAIYSASSQRLDVCAGDGWLAVGDAAGTFDPLSSQGVMKALRSGINASRAICLTLGGELTGAGGLQARSSRRSTTTTSMGERPITRSSNGGRTLPSGGAATKPSRSIPCNRCSSSPRVRTEPGVWRSRPGCPPRS